VIERPINQADIDGLAQTLDGLDLPPGQKALLSAIVGAAAEPIVQMNSVVVPVVNPVPSFREQFAAAFEPGTVSSVTEPESGIFQFKIGRTSS
jgi:hypothetical protein